VLTYARRILDLNDQAVAAVRGRAIEGTVRFGLPADFAETWLPAALARFNDAHPSVRIEATVDRNRRLLECVDKGELDLVLALDNPARADAQDLGTLPLAWIGMPSNRPALQPGEPVPLVMFEAPCFFRKRAIAALDRAGMPWRIAFTSTSLHGLWAAVEAGLGVTLRTTVGLPDRLAELNLTEALLPAPEPPLKACLHDAGRALVPAAVQLRSIVVETLRDCLRGRDDSRL
jgi:DNA-binding transcriptional LysR family regulator